MAHLPKTLIKQGICFAFVLFGLQVNAQIAMVQNAIDKLGSYNNLSYQYVYKQKEVFSDTLTINKTFVLLKQPQDKAFGYLFRYEFKYGGMKAPAIELYNGENLVALDPADSTYDIKASPVQTFSESSLAKLNWIEAFLVKHPSKITQLADTTYNSINSYHLVINIRDTVVNHDHIYVRKHLLINKATGLPVAIITRARTADFGKEVTDYYNADIYSNYKTNQDNITAATFAMPAGFHLPKDEPEEETAPLAPGTAAPNWTLYDTDGKKTTLAQLKGKIVLLDFFFIGCVPCMKTLGPLEKLQKKYKDKNLVVLSISTRDTKEATIVFKKVQRITNQMYPKGGDVAKLYHITGCPTFYFIDKEGKIASILGDPDDFEAKASLIIDGLVSK